MFDRAVFALAGSKGAFATCVACALGRALAAVGQAYLLASAIVFLWGGGELAGAAGEIAGFLICFIAQAAISCAQDAAISRYASKTASDLRRNTLETLYAKGADVVSEKGSSAVVETVVGGIDDVEEYLELTLPKLAALICVPVVLLACAFAVDWVSGLIMLVAYPTIVMFMILIGYNAEDAAARRYRQFGQLANHFLDSLRGMSTLRAFGRADSHGEVVFGVSERFRRATMKTLRIAQLSGAVLDLAATLALAAVAIMLGFRLVEGGIGFWSALFVLILTPEYFKPIREYAADYHATLDGRSALADVGELLAEPAGDSTPHVAEIAFCSSGSPDEQNAISGTGRGESQTGGEPDEQNAISATGGGAISATGRGAISATGKVELRGVSYAYPGSSVAAIDGVDLVLESGRRLGVIGASGSGKSTLASVLAGFKDPTAGTIALDGREVPTLRTPDWQRRVLYIPQRPYLFRATLRDNIRFYSPTAADDAVLCAMRDVGLEALLDELPDGLDTVVGEGGRTLSGGERQRVALARAIVDDTRRVLIFDEPTAHLDIETELELKEPMLAVMEGRTVVFATHRLHWMADMDEVLELGESSTSDSTTQLADSSRLDSPSRLAGSPPHDGSPRLGGSPSHVAEIRLCSSDGGEPA